MPRRTAIYLLFVFVALELMLLAASKPATGKSRSAGILPALDIYRWVARPWGPFAAAAIMILADFVAILVIRRLVEGDPTIPRYWTFRFNDTLFIPMILIGMGYALRAWTPSNGWYTQRWWHLTLLAFGFGLSLLMELSPVKCGYYTMAQELSPSKLWHTFIFAIVAYWMLSALVPLLVTQRSTLVTLTFAIGFAGFVSMVVLDTIAPMTKTGDHIEYNYRTGKSKVRSK